MWIKHQLEPFEHVDLINEARSDWQPNKTGVVTKSVDILNVGIRPTKSYGFICYDEDSDTVSLIAADSIEEMAEALSIDPEMIESIWNLKVGETDRDIINSATTIRIW